MKIRFYLKKKGNGPHPVYLALYEGNTHELIFSGHRIPLKEWSVGDKAPKSHTSDVAKSLEKIKQRVARAIRKLEFEEKAVTPFSVKQAYQETEDDKNAEQAKEEAKARAEMITVAKLADRWLEEETHNYRASTKRSVSESIKQFKEYLKWAGYANLERRQLDRPVISGFERYLIQKKKLSINTQGKRLKHIRWFLKTLDYPVTTIKIRSIKKRIIALTIDELRRLEAVDVSYSVEHTKSRDAFLLMCYTGLRVSDLRRLNPVNTQGGFITMKLQKNRKEVQIPIVKAAVAILTKYEWHSPDISEQALNECIKKVCKKAEITDKITIDDIKGNTPISITVPKYKKITSHIAGKTFISLAPQLFGLTPAEISSLVGKDLKTLINSYFADQGSEARRKMLEVDNRVQMKVV